MLTFLSSGAARVGTNLSFATPLEGGSAAAGHAPVSSWAVAGWCVPTDPVASGSSSGCSQGVGGAASHSLERNIYSCCCCLPCNHRGKWAWFE